MAFGAHIEDVFKIEPLGGNGPGIGAGGDEEFVEVNAVVGSRKTNDAGGHIDFRDPAAQDRGDPEVIVIAVVPDRESFRGR